MFQFDHFHSCRCIFFSWTFLVLGLIVASPGVRAFADELTVAEFERLSEAEQIDYLKEALLEFRRQTANISATVRNSFKNVDYDPASGRVGDKILLVGELHSFQLRRIGDSYRIVGDRELINPRPGEVVPTTIEAYDAQTGQGRQLDTTAQADQDPLHFGTIDTKRGSVTQDCFFFQYLGDHFGFEQDFGSWFLEEFDKARITRIDPESATVEASIPHPNWGPRISGTCLLRFDLNKNALLIGRKLHRVVTNQQVPVSEYTSDIELSDAIAVDGVWIPTKWRTLAWSSNDPDAVTLHEGTIADVKLNQLTPADLEVDFPPGTEVNDRITETRFRIGPDGKPIESTMRSEGTINAAIAEGQRRQQERIGQPFELEFQDAISGAMITMAEFQGQVVVLDFWATWCGPCVAEIPKLKALYNQYKDQGVAFIGVSLDRPEAEGGLDALKRFVAEHEIPWPQYYQGQGWNSPFSSSWGVQAIPTLFVVAPDGTLHTTEARGQLEHLIPTLLKQAEAENANAPLRRGFQSFS